MREDDGDALASEAACTTWFRASAEAVSANFRDIHVTALKAVGRPNGEIGSLVLTDTMDIRLNVRPEPSLRTQIGDVVVDHHVHLLNVDSARNNIRRDEDLGLAVPEIVQDAIAVLGLLLAVQRGNLMAFAGESFGDFVGGITALRTGSASAQRARTRTGFSSGCALQLMSRGKVP